MKSTFLILASAALVIFYSAFKKPILRKTSATPSASIDHTKDEIKTGAEQTDKYLSYLKGKRVGILANQTTIIGNRHLVDSLQKLGVKFVSVFGPEHGFRGNASNGAQVKDEIDSATRIPIVSLYGARRKPTKQNMESLDIMLFDIQDVGCRFYTYINVLRDVMEACAENNTSGIQTSIRTWCCCEAILICRTTRE